ncbi:MAG TPA: DJ-1/PfpI family protein [Thermoanaerobaculia bacterium]|nr:DJ-1/PfpI family protein [Thermoanaerobaculia bacterium]
MDSNPRRPCSIPALTFVVVTSVAGAACATSAPTGTASPAPTPSTATFPATTADPGGTNAADWKRVLPRPELPADRPLSMAFLLTDGVDGSELVAPLDVFHRLRSHLDGHGLRTFTVSPDGEAVDSVEGLAIAADHSFADAPTADVLIVPGIGGGGEDGAGDPELLEWIRRTGSAARWVVALRNGTFLLARAGLLDGRAATTFPAAYDGFAGRFPAVDLRVNVSFVHDGPALTSQGGARSFDVALYLVDHLFGEEPARRVAAELLLEWPPDQELQPRFVVVPPPPARP